MADSFGIIMLELNESNIFDIYRENYEIYKKIDMMEKGIKFHENNTNDYNFLNHYQYDYKVEIIDYFKNFYVNGFSFIIDLLK